MTAIYAIVNQKGGVAKTTTAVNLAVALAKRKKKVLLVDLDPQGNATSGLGVEKDQLTSTVYDALCGELNLNDVLVKVDIKGLDLLPSNINLAAAEQELAADDRRAFRLKIILEPIIEGFDFVLIDCPPSLGLLTINALTAANRLLVPIQCEFYALEGLSLLMQTIRRIQETTNPDLRIGGFVMTMYDGRMRLAKQVVADVRQSLGDHVFKTLIPRNVRLSEAPSFGQSIFEYDPLSKGARAYAALAKEVIKRGEK